jgi:hypothetical protein
MEQLSREANRECRNITCRCMVFPASRASPKLTSRMEDIDVVASNKVLSKVHNGHGERLFAVMMRGMFADVSNQLTDLLNVSSQLGDITIFQTNFQLALHFALEASKYDFTLTWFETINYRGNGADIVGHREQDELSVNELAIRNLVPVVV